MSSVLVHCKAPASYFGFEDKLKQHLRNGQLTALTIVPVNRAVRRLKRQMVMQAAPLALVEPPIFTFDQLFLHLFKALFYSKRLLPNDTLLILVQEILEQHPTEFSYLTSGQATNSGLIQRVWELVSELRRFGFTSTDLAQRENELNSVQPEKFDVFVRLLSFIEDKLGADFVDEPFVHKLVVEHLQRQQFEAIFPHVTAVYISGYGLFSPPMLQFIKKVGQWLPVEIELDYFKANEVLFEHTELALKKLQQLGAQIRPYSSKSFLARFLFHRQASTDKIDLRQKIKVVGLKNQQQEVAFIAGQIRQLHFNGLPLNKIAVTFSHLEKYVPLIRTVFEDYGIPFNLSTGFELLQSPLISLFVTLLKIIGEHLPTEPTLTFLQSQFIQLPEQLSLPLLHAYFSKMRVSHLEPTTLRSLKNYLSQKTEAEDEIFDVRQLEEQLSLLEQFLQPFFEFPQKERVTQFREKYLNLCSRLNLLHWYQRENNHLNERQREHNFRAYNRFVKIFERSIWSLQLIYGEQPIELKHLIQALERALKNATYNLSEWPEYGVQILPRLEVLAVDFDVLFLGGLVDGQFPRTSVKDIFFDDRARQQMGLIASENLLEQDRFLFYQLLESGAQQLFLTYPQYQNEEALVPSSFLADLNEIAEVDEYFPDEQADVFKNETSLWTDFGRNLLFVPLPDYLETAQNELQKLRNLNEQNEARLEQLLEQVEFSLERLMGLQFSRFEGALNTIEEIQNDLHQRFQNQIWSVSRLEMYAHCPMKFFLRDVLNIEPPVKQEDEMSPQERGSLLHRILFRFFMELKKQQATGEPWLYQDLLLNIAKQELAQLPYQGLFWELEKWRILGNEQLKGILPSFLEAEQKRSQTMPFVASYFELSFGNPNRTQLGAPSVVLKTDGKTLQLQGRIDRIDLDNHKNAVIIDYKSGSLNGRLIQQLKEGRQLQIPLYLKVLPQILKGSKPVYGGLYSLKLGRDFGLKPVVADKNFPLFQKARGDAYVPNPNFKDEQEEHQLTFAEVLDWALVKAMEMVERISQGLFHHTLTPTERFCQSYCEFRRMCQKVPGKLQRINNSLNTNSPEAAEKGNSNEK